MTPSFTTMLTSESSFPSGIWLCLPILIATLLWLNVRGSSTGSPALDSAPKIGISNVWFASLRAKVHYIKNGFRMIYEAYEKVGAS